MTLIMSRPPVLGECARHGMDGLKYSGELPLFGEVHLSSVLLFDLGVYMLVLGATVLMLIAIAHQSLRSSAGLRKPGGGAS